MVFSSESSVSFVLGNMMLRNSYFVKKRSREVKKLYDG